MAAPYNDYDRELIFKPIGKMIARFNELQSQIEDLETIQEELVTVVDDEPSEGSRELLTEAGVQHQDDVSTMAELKEAAKAVVTTYLLGPIREMLEVTSTDIASVLDALQDAMYIKGDSVLCQTVPPVEQGATTYDSRFDIDNAGVGSLSPANFHPQQTHDGAVLEGKVYDVSGGAGNEYWQLRMKRADGSIEILGTAQTGVLFQSEKYGFELTIQYYNTIQDAEVVGAQLSNWVLNGATKQKGDEETEPITEANADWYGRYFVKLYDTAGTRTVELYRDSARTTELVAQGSRVGDGTITLAAVGGSGLTGSVDVVYTGNDNGIVVRYPFEFERDDIFWMPIAIGALIALFQYFFVNEYDKALPCEGVGNTIDEAWAQWTP